MNPPPGPLPEGVPTGFHRQEDDLHAGPPPDFLVVGPHAAPALADLVGEYALFTPALLFTHARLDRDPVQEWVNTAPGTPVVAVARSDAPVFSGLRTATGDPVWNHTVLACEAGRWPELRRFLAGIVVSDSTRRTLWAAGIDSVRVVQAFRPVDVHVVTVASLGAVVRIQTRPGYDLPGPVVSARQSGG